MDDQNTGSSNLSVMDKLPPGFKEYLTGYYRTAKEVILTPKIFFESMPTTGGFKEPSIFLALGCSVSTILSCLLTLHIFNIPIGIIGAVFGSFVFAGIAFGVAKALGGKGTFEATFRVFAYSSCLQLLYWIPLVGLVVGLYGLVLAYLGIKKVHELSPVKSGAIVLVTGVLAAIVAVMTALTSVMSSILHH